MSEIITVCPFLILLKALIALLSNLSPLITALGCPGALKRKDLVWSGKSKSKSSNLASTVPRSKLDFGIVKEPYCPLKYPAGLGISFILNEETEDTLLPSGRVPETLIFTSLPLPGNKLYLLPLTRLSPGAVALILLS